MVAERPDVAGPVSNVIFGRPSRSDDELELMPSSVYLFGGLTLPLYPVGLVVNQFWLALGGLFVTIAVVRDAYDLVTKHDSDWRPAYVYPFLFVLGFFVYPLLLVVYLYHRRRGAARAAGRSHDDVEDDRADLDVPSPRAMYALLGYDLLVQVVLIGSTTGLLLAGSVAIYVVAVPVHGLYLRRDLNALRECGVRWGRRSGALHSLMGVVFVLVFVYLFQRTEHAFYTALCDPGAAEPEESDVPPGADTRDMDVQANRADVLKGE